MMNRQSRVPVVDASLSKGCESNVMPCSVLLSGRRSVGRFVVVVFQFGLVAHHATANTARIEAIISATSQGEL